MAGLLSKYISRKGGRKLKVSKFSLLIVLLFAVGLLFFTFWRTDCQNLYLQIELINILRLSVAILSIILYWVTESIILRDITFSLYGKYSFLKAFNVTMIGQFFNVVTPFASGGQPAQLYTMTKQRVGLGSAGSILMLKFIIYQTVLTVYSLALIIWKIGFFEKRMDNIFYLIFLGFIVNVSVIAFLSLFTRFKKLKEILLVGILKLLNKIKVLKDYQNLRKK